jgi:predicted dehydrogenase
MRALVVGTGSIGTRRARLLVQMGHEVYLHDKSAERMHAAKDATGAVPVPGWRDAMMLLRHSAPQKSAAFICTPAESHVPVTLDVLATGIQNVFIEKPLSTTTDGLPALASLAEGRCTMVACNMRWGYFPAGLPTLEPSAWSSLEFTSFDPLRQWRDGAVAAYAGNGIVLESAIHEMDVAVALAGPIVDIHAAGGGDRVLLWLEHEHCASLIRCDWSDNIAPHRELLAAHRPAQYGEVMIPGTRFRVSPPADVDAMYVAEMLHFVDCVESGAQPCNTVDRAVHVLEWALRAKELVA